MSSLLGQNYPFLQKEQFTTKENSRAAEACMTAAVMYGVTLAMSFGCCFAGREKTSGIGRQQIGVGGGFAG